MYTLGAVLTHTTVGKELSEVAGQNVLKEDTILTNPFKLQTSDFVESNEGVKGKLRLLPFYPSPKQSSFLQIVNSFCLGICYK